MFGLTYKGRVEGAHSFVVTDPAWRDYWCQDCAAFTWGRFVVYRSPRQFQNLDVRAHEGEHVRQNRRLGLLMYPLLYALEYARRGYLNNRFEVEARRAASKRVQHSVDQLQGAGLVVRCVESTKARQRTEANKSDHKRTRRVRAVIHFR